jgi:hypothetical protein
VGVLDHEMTWLLTEHIVWSNIKPGLVEFMEGMRVKRLRKERAQAIRKRGLVLSALISEYAATRPLHGILPAASDLAALETFRTVIEHTPIEEEVTAAHFQDSMANFPSLVEDWRRSKDRELLDMVKACPIIDSSDITESRLLFATTYFRCELCEAEIEYPRILVHKCTRLLFLHKSEVESFFIDLGSTPWNYGGKRLSFHLEAYAMAVTVLIDCSIRLDAKITEIQAADCRFECLSCTNEEKGRLVMRWPKVVRP